MNTLTGHIFQIDTEDQLSLVHVDVGAYVFKSIVLENPNTADYLREGQRVQLLFKETEVVLGKPEAEQAVSMQNRVPGTVSTIKRGKLLSEVTVTSEIGTVRSIITTGSVDKLHLSPGEAVTALIKTNEIMLAP
ncbi:MAG: TOBE domain-containing protein [Bacteroidota bacterium]